MKNQISQLFFVIITVFLLGLSSGCAEKYEAASLILFNGNVVTLDDTNPKAQAVAIANTRILAVGNNVDIRKLGNDETQFVDLRGKTVYPGFIEGHAHLLNLGNSQQQLNLRETKSWDEIVLMVAEAVSKAKPGEWIIGRGWHQEEWDHPPRPVIKGLPHSATLDFVAPNNPVLLSHASGHASIANQMAQDLAGIRWEDPDPEGGEIVHDQDGEMIGVFLENAEIPLDSAYAAHLATRTVEEQRNDKIEKIRLAEKSCLENGITGFHDAGASFATVDLYRDLAENSELNLRLYVMLSEDNDSLRAKIDEYRMIGLGDNHLTVRAIKRVIDGALGSHGAWLLRPYNDLSYSTGIPSLSIDSLAATARLAIEHGFQLCTHAIGDRGNRECLNVYEAAFKNHPDLSDLRWRIEHAQHVDPDDIPRFGKLGVIAAMQGVHCTSDGSWVPTRIGNERASSGAYMWRALIDSEAIVTNGTDAPVEKISPIEGFYASVTRRLPNGSVFYEEQRMTREEALKSYTINNARAAFEEDLKGTITPGKLADLTILSQDLLTIPEEKILNTTVDYTIIGGKIVYSSKRKR